MHGPNWETAHLEILRRGEEGGQSFRLNRKSKQKSPERLNMRIRRRPGGKESWKGHEIRRRGARLSGKKKSGRPGKRHSGQGITVKERYSQAPGEKDSEQKG